MPCPVQTFFSQTSGTGADLPIQSKEAAANQWNHGLISHVYLLKGYRIDSGTLIIACTCFCLFDPIELNWQSFRCHCPAGYPLKVKCLRKHCLFVDFCSNIHLGPKSRYGIQARLNKMEPKTKKGVPKTGFFGKWFPLQRADIRFQLL